MKKLTFFMLLSFVLGACGNKVDSSSLDTSIKLKINFRTASFNSDIFIDTLNDIYFNKYSIETVSNSTLDDNSSTADIIFCNDCNGGIPYGYRTEYFALKKDVFSESEYTLEQVFEIAQANNKKIYNPLTAGYYVANYMFSALGADSIKIDIDGNIVTTWTSEEGIALIEYFASLTQQYSSNSGDFTDSISSNYNNYIFKIFPPTIADEGETYKPMQTLKINGVTSKPIIYKTNIKINETSGVDLEKLVKFVLDISTNEFLLALSNADDKFYPVKNVEFTNKSEYQQILEVYLRGDYYLNDEYYYFLGDVDPFITQKVWTMIETLTSAINYGLDNLNEDFASYSDLINYYLYEI